MTDKELLRRVQSLAATAECAVLRDDRQGALAALIRLEHVVAQHRCEQDGIVIDEHEAAAADARECLHEVTPIGSA